MTTTPPKTVEQAWDALVAAQNAPTELKWSSNGVHYTYGQPLVALRDAQVASGRAVLAVAEEMPATRAEIAKVATAIEGLTTTLDSVLGELCARLTAVEGTLDAGVLELTGEVSEVCTELAEIGGALQRLPEPDDRRPVRRWLRRRGGGRR